MISDGITGGSIRPVDPEISAQMVTSLVNAAAHLSRWSPMATEANAADLFVQPLMTGVFQPGVRGA